MTWVISKGDVLGRCPQRLQKLQHHGSSEKNVGVQLTLSPWKQGGAASTEHHIKSSM